MFKKVLQKIKERMEAADKAPASSLDVENIEKVSAPAKKDGVQEILDFVDTHGTTEENLPQSIEKEEVAEVSTEVQDLSEFEEEGWSTGGEEILDWVDNQGVEFKSDDMPKAAKPSRSDQKTKKAHELIVDLHGLRKEGAMKRVTRVFNTAKSEGYGQLLIIHGRGNHSEGGQGKLKAMVYDLLDGEFADRVASYGFAPANEGGGGATRVVLK